MTEEDEKRPFCLINSLRPGITVYSGFYCGFLCFPLTPSLLPRGSSECLLAGVESHMRNSHRYGKTSRGTADPSLAPSIKHPTLLCLWLRPLCVQALVRNFSHVTSSASA